MPNYLFCKHMPPLPPVCFGAYSYSYSYSDAQEELNEHNLSIRALADKFEKELRARWQDRQRLRRSDESRRKRSDSGRRATQEEERELFAALR